MAQEYFVVYGQDSDDDSLLYFTCEGLDELLLDLSDLAQQLPDVASVSEWLGSFYVFADGTSAEKAAEECAHFIIEGKPGESEPVFPEVEDDEEEGEETGA